MAKLIANSEVDYLAFDLHNEIPRALNWVIRDILNMSENIISTEVTGLKFDEMLYNVCYLAHMLKQESLDATKGWVEMKDMRFTYVKDARRGTSPVSLVEIGALQNFINDHFIGYDKLSPEQQKEKIYSGVDKIQHYIARRDDYTLEGVVAPENAESDTSADDKVTEEPKAKAKAPKKPRKRRATPE